MKIEITNLRCECFAKMTFLRLKVHVKETKRVTVYYKFNDYHVHTLSSANKINYRSQISLRTPKLVILMRLSDKWFLGTRCVKTHRVTKNFFMAELHITTELRKVQFLDRTLRAEIR